MKQTLHSNHSTPNPYTGRTAILATKHGKEQQIAPPFAAALDLHISVPPAIDTDQLGTFSGEIPRHGSPTEVVLQKARLGMQQSNLPLGLANEGSFTPHPDLPMLTLDTEILLFVDDELDITVQEIVISEETVATQTTVHSLADLSTFLERAHFPSHALIVRPHAVQPSLVPDGITKGITDLHTLERAIKSSASISPDGLALVETDLRALMNPTRQRVIATAAQRLAHRLTQHCPVCNSPGWGIIDSVPGLPCEWCSAPTPLLREHIYGCPHCPHRTSAPRPDGIRSAPAARCPFCNP